MSNQAKQRRRTLRRRFKTQLQARRHTHLFLMDRRLCQLGLVSVTVTL